MCFLINSNAIIFALLLLPHVTVCFCAVCVGVLVTKGLSFVLGGNVVHIWALLPAILENAVR